MQQPSIFKPLLILVAAAVLLTVIHLAASFVTPVLMGFFVAALVTPIYRRFKKRLPAGLALLLTLVVLLLVVLFIVLLVGNSFATLGSSLAGYTEELVQRQAQLQAFVAQIPDNGVLKKVISTIDPGTLIAVLGSVVGVAASIFKQGVLVLFITLFALAEGPQIIGRMEQAFGADHFLPHNTRALFGAVISYFGLRAIVNLVVAGATGLMLWLLGIPHAGLWAVLTFFLSFIPYIGAFFAALPPVILAYAQGGLGLALVVILGSIIINSLTENIVSPLVMSKGLSVSPTVVFISFVFWMFILGGAGAFIAMPLTVALILFLGSFDETRGLAALMGKIPQSADQP